MANSILTHFNNDGIELVIDEKGEVFYPGYHALARVCSLGLSKPVQAVQVQRALGTVTINSLSEAEIVTVQGLRTVTLIPRKAGSSAIKKYNPDLWDRMGEAGHLVFLHQLAGYQVKSSLEPVNSSSLIDELTVLKFCLEGSTLDKTLASGIVMNYAATRMPQLASAANEHHRLVAATTDIQLSLTPTTIGEKLGLSAIKVNQLLTSLDLQIDRGKQKKKGEPRYVATEKGKRYAHNSITTGRVGDNTDYQHLKWSVEVIDVLRPHVVA